MPERYLSIYLNDHLAGATLGVELARRAERANEGTELGELLAWLSVQLVEDRAALTALMGRLGVRRSVAKVAGARLAERLGRLKPNGHLTTSSPLSRLVELEGLAIGIEGKLGLWRALSHAGVAGDFAPLVERAREQRERLEPHRLAAAAAALGGP